MMTRTTLCTLFVLTSVANASDSLGAIARDFACEGRPGLMAGLVLDGHLEWSLTTGLADLDAGAPVTSETLFPLASVAKSFTGFAVALLAERGALDLNAPLELYLPEATWLGPRVPVRTLVHHTSGVDDAAGLLALAGWRSEDLPARADVVRILCAQEHLRWPAGEREAYGNGGYVLLAEIVARASGADFPRFVQDVILRPVGMERSGFGSLAATGRARTYTQRDGRWIEARYGEFEGAGGLFSSVEDLARWGAHLAEPKVGGEAVLERVRQPGTLLDGTRQDYAFGLGRAERRGVEVFQHSGGAPGIQSRIVWVPALDLFVFAAANSDVDEKTPFELIERLLDFALADAYSQPEPPMAGRTMAFVPLNPDRPAESVGVEPDPEVVRAAEGSYRMEDGQLLAFRADGTRLSIALEGQPPYIEVYPLDESRFVFSPLGWQFVFEPDEHGQVGAVTRIVPADAFGSSGAEEMSVGERVEPPRIDGALARELEGPWYSPELGSLWELRFDGTELWLCHPRHAPVALVPTEQDAFALDSKTVARIEVVRDDAARVLGLDFEAYSWGARGRFERP